MPVFSAPYGQNNYLGVHLSEADALTWLRARKWDTTKDGLGTPEVGMFFIDMGAGNVVKYFDGVDWKKQLIPSDLPTPQRITYGDVHLIHEEQPWPATVVNLADVSSAINKRGREIYDHLDADYSRCLWDISVPIGPTTYTGLTFANQTALVNWINANVPNNSVDKFTVQVFARVYDIIDPAIRPPQRLWGKNATFASLRAVDGAGGGARWSHYWRGRPYVGRGEGLRWPHLDAFLIFVWQTCHGQDLTGLVTDDAAKAFWLPGGKRILYNQPMKAFQKTALGYTYKREIATGNFVATGELFTAGDPIYVLSDVKNGAFTYISSSSWPRYALSSIWTDPPTSVVACYPMTNMAGDLAIYIKPIGTDQYFIDWFDDADYRLEYVGNLRADSRPRLRVHTSVFALDSDQQNSRGILILHDFLGSCFQGHPHQAWGHSLYPGQTRLRLRRLTDNKVSPCSLAAIDWVHNRRYDPLSMRVRVKTNVPG